MKKKKSTWKHIEEKRFYIALLGCLVVVAFISLFMDTKKTNYDHVADLNEDPNSNIEAGNYGVNIVDNNPLFEDGDEEETEFHEQSEITINKGEPVDSELPTVVIGTPAANNGEGDEGISGDSSGTVPENVVEDVTEQKSDEVEQSTSNDSQVEASEQEDVVNTEEKKAQNTENLEIADSSSDTESVEAFSNTGIKESAMEAAPITNFNVANLHFNKSAGVHFPMAGNVIIPFSSEIPVLFKTLNQYRTNPAIYVKGNVGDEVQVVSNGVVEKVEKSSEYGMLVTVNHGDGYKSYYGQLSSEGIVDEGQMLEQGKVIGKIEKPTAFYLVEGSHLYFKMTKDDNAINPMMLVQQ